MSCPGHISRPPLLPLLGACWEPGFLSARSHTLSCPPFCFGREGALEFQRCSEGLSENSDRGRGCPGCQKQCHQPRIFSSLRGNVCPPPSGSALCDTLCAGGPGYWGFYSVSSLDPLETVKLFLFSPSYRWGHGSSERSSYPQEVAEPRFEPKSSNTKARC